MCVECAAAGACCQCPGMVERNVRVSQESVAPSHPPDLTQCDCCSLTLGDLNAVTSKDGVSMCNVGNYVGIERVCVMALINTDTQICLRKVINCN